MKFTVPLCLALIISGYPYLEGKKQACPNGFCHHNNYCFLIVGLNVTWIDARSYCTVLGGSLLSINSKELQTTAEGALRRSKGVVHPGRYWLDVSDIITPFEWMYMSLLTPVTYTNMYNESIRNADTEQARNCMEMSDANDYKWTTVSCDEKLNFVCYTLGKFRRRSRYRSNDVMC